MANLNPYSSFATDLTGWSPTNTGALARSTAQFKDDTASCLVTVNAIDDGLISDYFHGCAGSTVYQLSFWVYCLTGNIDFTVGKNEADQPGGYLTNDQEGPLTGILNTWTELKILMAATDPACEQIQVYIQNGSSTNDFYIDKIYFGPEITVTLDDCLPDADVTTTGWTTTPLFSKINDASDATVIQATAV